MENGVSGIEDAKLGQAQRVDREVLKVNNLKERLDGANELSGDEVFYQAVEEDSSSIDSESSVRIDGEKVELIDTLENGEENLNLVGEADEEGFRVTKSDQDSEDHVVNGKVPDEEQIADDKDCSVILNGIGDSREVDDSVVNGKIDNLCNGDKVNEKLVDFHQKAEGGELDHVKFVKSSTAEDAVIVDDESTELKEIDLASVELRKVDTRDADKEEKNGISVGDTSVGDGGKGSYKLETNLPSAVEENTASKVEKPHFSSSRLVGKSSRSSATPRPAGLGGACSLLEPPSQIAQPARVNAAISQTLNQITEDPTNGEAEEYDETSEKLQMIRVKFLRLAHRLGQTTHNLVVAQVLYRLGLAEQLRGGNGGRRVAAFSFDRASAMAEQLEAAGQEPLDFTCTIMVLGKSGVGKTSTINSIFDRAVFGTDAFESGTKKVQDIVGTVHGIKVRVIDTPGLLPSWTDECQNRKILHSVQKFIKKTPPDIVLYLDRLDMMNGDFCEMRTITEVFGPSIWFNAIIVLTHAASAPPEGPNGMATGYDTFVTQRSHFVQQALRQAAGDMRLMNPVSLVENHSLCRKNRAGQRVLPNGQIWKPHLLLLSFASKILAEANTLLKLQDSPLEKTFAPRRRSPPLPYLLSSLLQSKPQVKRRSDQFGEDDDGDTGIDDDLDECSDSEDELEYDELPPFKPLTKAQLDTLSKLQRTAYYDELEYREKLFMKKQMKEAKKERKMMKKMQEAAKEALHGDDSVENDEEENRDAASVQPDMTLPSSFDSDNPTHRYRALNNSSNHWLVRPVLEPNGWDHDTGYDGVNIEKLFLFKDDKVPVSFSAQISKDKKDTNLQMEIASSVKHGKGKATSVGFDVQSVGKGNMAYTLRSETTLLNQRKNTASAGLTATLLGDVLTGGIKVEDRLTIGKHGQIVVSGGANYGSGDVAYGGSLEATLGDSLGRFLSTFGLSVMEWQGETAIGCNSQTQIPLGRHANLIGRFNVNNKGSGQVSVRINSFEHIQILLIGLIPLVQKILGWFRQNQNG